MAPTKHNEHQLPQEEYGYTTRLVGWNVEKYAVGCREALSQLPTSWLLRILDPTWNAIRGTLFLDTTNAEFRCLIGQALPVSRIGDRYPTTTEADTLDNNYCYAAVQHYAGRAGIREMFNWFDGACIAYGEQGAANVARAMVVDILAERGVDWLPREPSAEEVRHNANANEEEASKEVVCR